jgi:phosphotransacetylase
VHVLQRGATVEEIVNMAAIAVVDAQKHVGQLPVAPRITAA